MLILGGGVCGLAAAWRLLEQGCAAEVTILESAEKPGGLARSLTINGHLADLGPHRIFTELPDVQKFLEDLAGPDLVEVRRISRMWLNGRWIEYPPKVFEVIGALGVFKLAGAGASFLAGKTARTLRAAQSDRESFESVMVDAFGRGLYELLVGRYARKVWKVPGTELHADIARVRVSAGGLDRMVRRLLNPNSSGPQTALQKFHYIAGGVEGLVHKLVSGIESRGGKLLLDRHVDRIDSRTDGSSCVTAKHGDSRETYDADAVIATTPLPELVGMIGNAPETVTRAVGGMRYIANFLVGIQITGGRISDAQWLYFPGEDTLFNRGYEPRNFHDSMTPDEDKSLIVLEVTCHRDDANWNLSDEGLTTACIDGLVATGLATRDRCTPGFVHRIPGTYPLYDLEYRERMDAVLGWLREFPRLVVTGRQGLFLHNNMDHSMHMGFRAAESLAEAHPSASHYEEIRRFQQFRIVD